VVLKSVHEEQQRAARVPLARLDVPSALVEQLALLGIRTVGELLALPGTQLKIRYGAEAARLHEFLSGRAWSPLLPRVPEPPLIVELEVEPPDDDHGRLLFGLKGLLHRVTSQLEAEQHAITALELSLSIERHARHTERIEAAAPTLDVTQIIDLVRLRLSALSLPGKTERMIVTVEHVRVYARQLGLYRGDAHGQSKSRDLEAAARALARLRASFGPKAVTCARLRDGHLPEARFGYEPVNELRAPRVITANEAAPAMTQSSAIPLVRRLYATPLPLPWPSGPAFARAARGDEPYSAAPGAVAASAITLANGPDRISGQWWSSSEQRRDYYYVETSSGEVLWVFYDEHKKRWLLHGSVD
jgi:protein ImuB